MTRGWISTVPDRTAEAYNEDDDQPEPRPVMPTLMRIRFEIVTATPVVIELLYRQPSWLLQGRDFSAKRRKILTTKTVWKRGGRYLEHQDLVLFLTKVGLEVVIATLIVIESTCQQPSWCR